MRCLGTVLSLIFITYHRFLELTVLGLGHRKISGSANDSVVPASSNDISFLPYSIRVRDTSRCPRNRCSHTRHQTSHISFFASLSESLLNPVAPVYLR
ncbi:uncharacterized protein CLUP02_13971 [Colletotrichum lupini]|uniref:Secreted protein n=1 Tax=Colletotrichum lupini TaxID=145971 RepID=A0A9Q8WMM5_9PEZI|nr:uncharacterized protein CLUP02_13971 [Colletotrichum lupini]KAK1716553.1 hypothetical protein BDP67DRAFT_274318 [Colletotrichum lupini]UQC88447.1 hypothetical protein CLUP02_13971 [Colletotrichum lupini]